MMQKQGESGEKLREKASFKFPAARMKDSTLHRLHCCSLTGPFVKESIKKEKWIEDCFITQKVISSDVLKSLGVLHSVTVVAEKLLKPQK